MTENIPPSTSSAQNPSTTATTAATTTATAGATPSTARADDRGRPYYESLRTSLRATLEKKRKLDEQLAALEDTIFKTEGAYLEETAGSGNIVRGFDGWVKGVQVSGRSNTGGAGGLGGGGGGDDRRRGGGPTGTGTASGRVRDDDRVFSRSSVGWMKEQSMQQQAQDGTDSNTASNAPTPSAGPGAQREGQTPTTAGTKAPNKKKRPTEKDEDEDSKSSKRGKITYARD